jgi:hypothetical protein
MAYPTEDLVHAPVIMDHKTLLGLSFVPSLHGTTGSSCYLPHDDITKDMDGDDISIRTTEEMEK